MEDFQVIPNLIKQVFHGRRIGASAAPAYPDLEHPTHGTLTGNSHQAVAMCELLCISFLLSEPFSAAMMHPRVESYARYSGSQIPQGGSVDAS